MNSFKITELFNIEKLWFSFLCRNKRWWTMICSLSKLWWCVTLMSASSLFAFEFELLNKCYINIQIHLKCLCCSIIKKTFIQCLNYLPRKSIKAQSKELKLILTFSTSKLGWGSIRWVLKPCVPKNIQSKSPNARVMLKVQTPLMLYGKVRSTKLMAYQRSNGETAGFIFANSKGMFVEDRSPAPYTQCMCTVS